MCLKIVVTFVTSPKKPIPMGFFGRNNSRNIVVTVVTKLVCNAESEDKMDIFLSNTLTRKKEKFESIQET